MSPEHFSVGFSEGANVAFPIVIKSYKLIGNSYKTKFVCSLFAGVQYCQITKPCLCVKRQIWVTKVRKKFTIRISGGAKAPPAPPPARSMNIIFRNEDWNLLGHQTHSANRSGTMFDVCERVVLVLCRWCSFPNPEKRE